MRGRYLHSFVFPHLNCIVAKLDSVSFYIYISVVFEFSGPSFYTTYVYIASILFSWVPIRNIINRHPLYPSIYPFLFRTVEFFFIFFTRSKEFSNVIGIFFRPPFIRLLYANGFRMNFISARHSSQVANLAICERYRIIRRSPDQNAERLAEERKSSEKIKYRCMISKFLARISNGIDLILHESRRGKFAVL